MVAKIAMGSWMAWLMPTAAKGINPKKSKLGTSKTGPPVPVRDEPKPTPTPIKISAALFRVCEVWTFFLCFERALKPEKTIKLAKIRVSAVLDKIVFTFAPKRVAGMIPRLIHKTGCQAIDLCLAYMKIPTRPVNKKLKLLVAWAIWSSVPTKKNQQGC